MIFIGLSGIIIHKIKPAILPSCCPPLDELLFGKSTLLLATPVIMWVLPVSWSIVKTINFINICGRMEARTWEMKWIHNRTKIVLEAGLIPVIPKSSIKKQDSSNRGASGDNETYLDSLVLCIAAVTHDGNSILLETWLIR